LSLAFDERQCSEILAVQVKQIEGDVDARKTNVSDAFHLHGKIIRDSISHKTLTQSENQKTIFGFVG